MPIGADCPAVDNLPDAVACTGLAKAFGDVNAVGGVDFAVRPGEIAALLGPSGCGKTTMLRLFAGFERPDAGRIEIAGRVVADAAQGINIAPEKRRIGMVFQDFALFPHLSVAKNVGYALGRRPDARRVDELLDFVGLGGLGERQPHELSGGQQQRVALARALAIEPALILLDEPFSNLDASLRSELRGEVRRLLREAQVSALIVTHDQDEALSMADHLAVMHDGCIEQSGSPEQVYLEPANGWIARFLGDVNVLPGRIEGGAVETPFGRLPAPDDLAGASAVEVLLRPESLRVRREGHEPGTTQATVLEREFFGHDQLLRLELASGVHVHARRLGHPAWLPGDRVAVTLDGPFTVIAAESAATAA
ncbi:MAG: ABC transporter ATP-binding protein [Solirubrobacteraceae bacterium]|nr:ABC transporter ATP-binding protein [Solirubrobacteraceae bacterium]